MNSYVELTSLRDYCQEDFTFVDETHITIGNALMIQTSVDYRFVVEEIL